MRTNKLLDKLYDRVCNAVAAEDYDTAEYMQQRFNDMYDLLDSLKRPAVEVPENQYERIEQNLNILFNM